MSNILEILKKTEAVLTDSHFVGTSGRHMSIYVNKDRLLTHPSETEEIAKLLAQTNKDLDVEVVAAPVVGAVILGHLTAQHLSKMQGKEVLSVYADKTDEGPLVFKRGYDELIKGKKVLIIEDTIATGLSIHKMIDAVKEFGGHIQGLSVIVNRVPKEITSQTLGFHFNALCEIPAETYEEKDCPLCASGIPINVKVGHGKKYLQAKGLI